MAGKGKRRRAVTPGDVQRRELPGSKQVKLFAS